MLCFRYFEELNTSYQSPFYELRNAMQNNPVQWFDSSDKVFNAVREGNNILVLQDDEKMAFDADKYCDFVYMPVCFFVGIFYYG